MSLPPLVVPSCFLIGSRIAVIFVLIICLLAVLRQLQIARNKLKAARADVAQERKRFADVEANLERPPSSMSLPGSPQDDRYEDSHVALLPPPALRPQSRPFSSTPSVRSSTLYDFTPQQEAFGFDLKPYRPPTVEQPQPQPAPKHIAEISMATLPNPHSEHGHGATDDDDDDDTDSMSHESSLVAPLPTSSKPSPQCEDSGSLKTPQPRSRAGSDSSWAANVVNALERGPTPMSRTTTVSTTVSAYTDDASTPVASGPVHELLLSRQRDSGSHSPPASGIN